MQLSLIGCCETKDKPVDLLYAVTCRKSADRIFNASQTAAFILNQSRKNFFSLIYTLLKVMDPGKFECCYFDTDSILACCTFEDPRANVRPERLEEFDRARLFEDEHSKTHQSGLLKLESFHYAAYFRNLKTYFLGDGGEEGGEECIRVRGIPRKTHTQIPLEAFGWSNNDLVVRNMALRPTMGFQIGIFRESKALCCSANLKRLSSVSIVFVCCPLGKKFIFFFSSKDTVHTVTL
jgi:hypothetical protein